MIWRRILIQNDKTLADLHYVIQITMGWTDYHLNEFTIHGKRYTIANWGGMGSANGTYASDIKLKDLKLRINKKFRYEYDFTVGWEFEIRLEKMLPANEKKLYPTCISGSGASPEEECGDPDAFNFLKDKWFVKSYEEYLKYAKKLLKVMNNKEKYKDKAIKDIFDIPRLREVMYWFYIDKYEHKQANKYLKLYAKNDDAWQDAFAEVIHL